MLSRKDNFILGIGGPTAVGKTSISIRLAQKYNIPILSCDSRQFFKELNIGTAKPNKEELSMAEHFFIDNKSIREEYSVGDFEREAIQKITELHKKYDSLIMCGGSGLYHKAIDEGLDEFPSIPSEIRNELIDELERKGLSALLKELEKMDPVYYAKVDRNNPRRVLRALEVIRASHHPFSFYHGNKKQRSFHFIKIFLLIERDELYTRINQRVEDMISLGLEEEVRGLIKFKHLNALYTVGYQEWWEYFDGNINKEKLIELIQRNSRRYAKRQITWFKNQGWTSFHPENWDSIIEHIESEKKRLST